ncbi:MAG: OmpA family protein [Elusimicrobia bacterium]|nr:OmpA family protein [Elusimicrobiota bacterium]
MSVWYEREDELEANLNRGAMWSVTYGDLMSYLAIFFLLMYSAFASNAVNMQMDLNAIKDHYNKEADLFSRHGIQQIAKLEVGEDRMRILFSAPVLFDPGEADLKPMAEEHLKKLAAALQELPNPIQIEGHTDDRPLGRHAGFKANWELSAARAFAVLRCLERNGVPSSRLAAIGYGEHKPVALNDTSTGREANRRIEINLLRRRE